ncbi:hypothetical protein FRC04_011619 [Tulasnella sp. 424]|nr:hypothetical protein FRC04_011619 [Tulasnella sp. 424]KAG8967201.1 hypothetical protein FRC05_002276 [Tulasnella sp. 425]
MAQGPPHDQDDGPGPSHTKEESDPNRKPDGSRFEDYAFFWKVSQPYGWASQWYWEPFDGPARLEGGPPLRPDESPIKSFVSCEHFMMYHKAVLFGDMEVADQILEATRPIEVKDLGRQVSNFNEDIWVTQRYDIVLAGNKAKFSAIADIRQELLATGDKILVEASPFDKIYGIGFTWKEALENKHKWGLNVLGKVLMEVRQWLRDQEGGESPGASHDEETKKE